MKHSCKHRGRSEEAVHGANEYGITVFSDGFLLIIGNFLCSSCVRQSYRCNERSQPVMHVANECYSVKWWIFSTFCFFFFLHSIFWAELWTTISIAEYFKCAHILVDVASEQDDAEEWYADVDTEEEIKANPFQDSSSSEENEDDLERHHKLQLCTAMCENKIG